MVIFKQTTDSSLPQNGPAKPISEQAYLDLLIDQALDEAFETSDAIDFVGLAELATRHFNEQRAR